MRLLKSTACLLLVLLCAGGVSHAALATTQATVTYTADNMVNAWWLIGPSQTTQPLPLGTNSTNWQLADSHQLDLQPGQSYQIIWEVRNLWSQQYPPGSNNPAGFLAQISFGGQSPLLTSNSWMVANYTTYNIPFDQMTWVNAATWGANSGSNIWNTVNSGAIAGIDGNAQWIWSSDNIWGQHIFVATQFTAPVPIPGAAWLLGAGLVGLVALRRRKS